MLNTLKRDFISMAAVFLPYTGLTAVLYLAYVLADHEISDQVYVLVLVYWLIYLMYSSLTLVAMLAAAKTFHVRIISDEAYLNMTLPVRPWVYPLSNFICSSVWFFAVYFISDILFYRFTGYFTFSSSAVTTYLELNDLIRYAFSGFLSSYAYFAVIAGLIYFSFTVSTLFGKTTGLSVFLFFILCVTATLIVQTIIFSIIDCAADSYSISGAGPDALCSAVFFAVYFTISCIILCRRYNRS